MDTEWFMDYVLPYILVGFFVLLIFYALYLRRHFDKNSLSLGAALGFSPFRGEKGYSMRAQMDGLEVLLDLVQDIATRDNPPYYTVKVLCRVPASSCKRLCVYPESALGLHRPVGLALPPEIKNVDYWDWYTVRGEPGEVVARVLPAARRGGGGVFRDEFGFRLLELEGGALVCHFRLDGRADPVRVKEMVRGAVALAVRLNAA